MSAMTVTAATIESVRETLPLDMRDEIQIGCEVYKTTDNKGRRLTVMTFPDAGRAGLCWDENTVWGDLITQTDTADGSYAFTIRTDDGETYDMFGNLTA